MFECEGMVRVNKDKQGVCALRWIGVTGCSVTNRWAVGHKGHPEGLESAGVADTGQHQYLGRVNGATAQNDLELR